jgi:hypothetical protein
VRPQLGVSKFVNKYMRSFTVCDLIEFSEAKKWKRLAWLGKNRMNKHDKTRLYFKLGSKSQIGVYPADVFHNQNRKFIISLYS